MGMRWGLGPVFAIEWVTTSRRWQVYAGRSAFVGILLIGLGLAWSANNASLRTYTTVQAMAALGESLYMTIVGIQITLVLLAAPAATAGSICLDKARGNLAHLLITDLSDAEIVLGKLAARLAPVAGMVFCALPVMALGTLLGGIDPNALFGSFLVTLGLAIFGCSLALTLSVWGSKTHEVLLAVYAIIILWLLAFPIFDTFAWLLGFPGLPVGGKAWLLTNPYYLAFAPYTDPGAVSLITDFAFLGAMVLLSAMLAVVAVLRVRAVTVRYAGRSERVRRDPRWKALRDRLFGWWPRPSLDGNPVLWREWHRQRPSRWVVVVWGLYFALAGASSLIVILNDTGKTGGRSIVMGAFVNAFQVAIGLLLLSVSSATSLAEERVRGSLDVLLTTPLSTRSILVGKWLGAFRSAPALAVLPVLVAGSIAWRTGRWTNVVLLALLLLSYSAALTSLGLAMATFFSRLGRAVGLTVSAYVFMTVGWLFLVFALFQNDDAGGAGLAIGSPFYGALFATLGVRNPANLPNSMRDQINPWTSLWSLAYLIAAGLLFRLVVARFDACLGRASEAPRVPIRGPLPAPKPKSVLVEIE